MSKTKLIQDEDTVQHLLNLLGESRVEQTRLTQLLNHQQEITNELRVAFHNQGLELLDMANQNAQLKLKIAKLQKRISGLLQPKIEEIQDELKQGQLDSSQALSLELDDD